MRLFWSEGTLRAEGARERRRRRVGESMVLLLPGPLGGVWLCWFFCFGLLATRAGGLNPSGIFLDVDVEIHVREGLRTLMLNISSHTQPSLDLNGEDCTEDEFGVE